MRLLYCGNSPCRGETLAFAAPTMESNPELRAAKKQKTSSPNSRNQQYPVPGKRFAMSQLGKAKAGRHCKSIEDVLPYVSCSGIKHAKPMLQQRAESSLRFTWRGGPLLLLRLWLLVKGFVVLCVSARTESASPAVFSSLAAVCSLISGPGASSTGGSVLQEAAEDLEEAAKPSPPKKAGDVNGGGGGSPPAGAATERRTGCNGSVGGQDMLHELLFEVSAMQALFRQLQTQPLQRAAALPCMGLFGTVFAGKDSVALQHRARCSSCLPCSKCQKSGSTSWIS